MKTILHLTAGDNESLNLSMVLEFENKDALQKALETSVPHMLTHGTATIHINTLNWKLGVATVQQNKSVERSERYAATRN